MKKADWNTYENELEKTIDEILTMDPRKKDLGIYFERFRNKNGIVHYKELDAVVFERMYGRMPEKSEALKIRYWRCASICQRTGRNCCVWELHWRSVSRKWTGC